MSADATVASDATTLNPTLRALEVLLKELRDGPSLYESMANYPIEGWGTVIGQQYSLGVTEEDGSCRTVISWKVRECGFVDLVKFEM